MFMNADVVVKAVMVGLAIASLVTWTVWLAKSIEIMQAKRKARAGVRALGAATSLSNVDTTENLRRQFLRGGDCRDPLVRWRHGQGRTEGAYCFAA